MRGSLRNGASLTLIALLSHVACRQRPRAIATPAQVGLVESMIELPGGEFIAQRDHCGPGDTRAPGVGLVSDVRVRGARFWIDREVASCAQLDLCIRAGACSGESDHECVDGVAAVRIDVATAFCAWRGLRLQTHAQWDRAARGTEGWRYPNGKPWDPKTQCDTINQSFYLRRCRFTTVDGFVYGLMDHGMGEWTRDTDCIEDSPGTAHRFEVAVEESDDYLDALIMIGMQAEIRCVRDGFFGGFVERLGSNPATERSKPVP